MNGTSHAPASQDFQFSPSGVGKELITKSDVNSRDILSNTNQKDSIQIKIDSDLDDILNGLSNAFSDSDLPISTSPAKKTASTSKYSNTLPKHSSTGYSKPAVKDDFLTSYTCCICDQSIVGKFIKLSEKRVYHPEHFKCQSTKQKLSGEAQCGKQLTQSNYQEHDSILYCSTCHTDAFSFKCGYCDMPIKDVLCYSKSLYSRNAFMRWERRSMHTTSFVLNVANHLILTLN